MNVFAVFIALCVALSQADLNITDAQKGKLIEHHKVCSGQVKVQDDILQKLLEGVFPEDQTFKEYLLCLSKRIGFQNEAGQVQKQVIVAKIKDSIPDPSKAEEYTEKCLVEGDPAEVVYKVVSCLQKITPNSIF